MSSVKKPNIDLVHDLVYYVHVVVNIHEAKTHLSRLINRVLSGEKIIIAKNGTPLIKMTPVDQNMMKRKPGLSKGKITYTADFADPLPDDIAAEFEK